MIVEKLESFYREAAANANEKPRTWNRASSIGRCPRELGFTKLGVKGEATQPRLWAVFLHGTSHDIGIKQDLLSCLDVVQPDVKGTTELEGITISGETDALFLTDDGKLAVFELKTCADITFEKAQRGEIDFTYTAQAWTYTRMFGVKIVVFAFYRKETSHICEIVFDQDADVVTITQRFGADPIQLVLNGPILLTKVISPFGADTEERVRASVRAVRDCTSLETLPLGVDAVEDEKLSVQGKVKAEPFKAQYGEPVQSGSWYTFQTGRRILGFPCSYCAFKKHCFPEAQLEIVKNAPRWVLT